MDSGDSDCLLVEEARAWVARWASLEVPPLHVDPDHRWRIRSSLQKAVRRGHGHWAVKMALALHRLDPRYAWRSILTVAVEDVGLGTPETVLWSTLAQRTAFHRPVGEVPLLVALVRRMAEAIKSRSAIELAFVVETGEPEIFRLFGGMSTDQLLDRFAGSDIYEAYAALAVLRGIVPRTYRGRPPDRAGVLEASEMLTDQMDAAPARCAKAALLRPLDNMSIAFVVACRLAGKGICRKDILLETPNIDGFPAETFDQHERLGRLAIERLARALQPRSLSLSRLTVAKARCVVADAVFVEEGQCLDRWLGGSSFDRLRDEADSFALTRHGLSHAESLSVRHLVRDHLADLHELRRQLATAPR